MAETDNKPPVDQSEDLDTKLLDLLVCPLTKTRLRFDRERCELVSEAAKLAYPVRGGVPIMLPSEARSLDID
ncbi:Trm112 family protein [Oricola sp.]|uniref:Trm112 family protein n=1 Tax=Oricola sp. TaxID=1979950 RepID=UPI0025E962AA|nr:Trm112 family protein [Oricola sp.]MCI5075497.1 Trm112 family protein [Oricola sp.]